MEVLVVKTIRAHRERVKELTANFERLLAVEREILDARSVNWLLMDSDVTTDESKVIILREKIEGLLLEAEVLRDTINPPKPTPKKRVNAGPGS